MNSNIILQQPQSFDIVDRTILVAGVGVGFEGTISLYVGDGHYEIASFTTAGGTSLRQFQAQVVIPNLPTLPLKEISNISVF